MKMGMEWNGRNGYANKGLVCIGWVSGAQGISNEANVRGGSMDVATLFNQSRSSVQCSFGFCRRNSPRKAHCWAYFQY